MAFRRRESGYIFRSIHRHGGSLSRYWEEFSDQEKRDFIAQDYDKLSDEAEQEMAAVEEQLKHARFSVMADTLADLLETALPEADISGSASASSEAQYIDIETDDASLRIRLAGHTARPTYQALFGEADIEVALAGAEHQDADFVMLDPTEIDELVPIVVKILRRKEADR